MNIKTCIYIVFILNIIFGCSTTQRLGDPGLSKNQLAIIKIETKKGSCSSVIKTIDGETINNGVDLVFMEPGQHDISFDFQQITDYGIPIGFCLSLFGNRTDLISPKAGRVICSTQPITISSSFEAGNSYCIDISTLKFEPFPLTEFEQKLKRELGDLYEEIYQEKFILTGSASIQQN